MSILIINTSNKIQEKLYDFYKKVNIDIKFINTISSINEVKDILKLSNITNIILASSNIDIEYYNNKNNFNNEIEINKKIITLCKKEKLKLIYLSSSEVYGDSLSFSLNEDSPKNPINNLGKLESKTETFIQNNLTEYFIFRCSWIFGTSSCYVKEILKNINTPLFFCSDRVVNPTPINLLIQILDKCRTSKNYGIFNCATMNSVSKLDFTKHLFLLADTTKNILPFPEQVLKTLPKTSKNASLDCSKLIKNFDISPLTWENGLLDYLNNEILK